jgi:hypothetical protein
MVPIAQSPVVALVIGALRAPEKIVLHFGAGGGATVMIPGSVDGPTGGHPGFVTEAIFVIIPLVAVTFTGIVISGKLAFAAIIELFVHTIATVPVHVHPAGEIAPFNIIPDGSVSVTVVTPLVDAGPSFLTRMT